VILINDGNSERRPPSSAAPPHRRLDCGARTAPALLVAATVAELLAAPL
jgi:hypothetical protein